MNITCPDLTSTTESSTTQLSTTTVDLSTRTYIKSLENEIYRLKVGLGVGLGSGMLITTGLAIASYIYFSQRYEALFFSQSNFSILSQSCTSIKINNISGRNYSILIT